MARKEKKESVDVELSDEIFMKLALLAHENDITFNKQCELIIEEALQLLKLQYGEK